MQVVQTWYQKNPEAILHLQRPATLTNEYLSSTQLLSSGHCSRFDQFHSGMHDIDLFHSYPSGRTSINHNASKSTSKSDRVWYWDSVKFRNTFKRCNDWEMMVLVVHRFGVQSILPPHRRSLLMAFWIDKLTLCAVSRLSYSLLWFYSMLLNMTMKSHSRTGLLQKALSCSCVNWFTGQALSCWQKMYVFLFESVSLSKLNCLADELIKRGPYDFQITFWHQLLNWCWNWYRTGLEIKHDSLCCISRLILC